MEDSKPVHPWELLSSEPVAEYSVFSVRQDEFRSPRDGEVHGFDIVASQNGVTVIALTDEGKLILVEQYRHGIRQLSLETPSGFMDEGEAPEAAGGRELLEETGYEADDLHLLGTLAQNPSWATTRVHVVVARGVRDTGKKNLDASEDTRVRLMGLDEVWACMVQGTICSATVIAGLHLFRLAEERGGDA